MSKRSASSVPSGVEVIDLLDDSDDEAVVVAKTPATAAKRLKVEPAADSKDDGGGKMGRTVLLNNGVRTVTPPDQSGSSDDEVQWIPHVDRPMEPASAAAVGASASATDGDEEVEVIGCQNVLNLPHMRQHCTKFAFVEDVLFHKTGYNANSLSSKEKVARGEELNPKHCDMCYCFVCDAPVSECTKWTSATMSSPKDCHCLASDKGVDSFKWTGLRKGAGRSSDEDGSDGDSGDDSDNAYNFNFGRYGHLFRGHSPQRPMLGDGPHPPDHAAAASHEAFTKCRKCGWFSRLNDSIRSPGVRDWCRKCGRIASDRGFEKIQSLPHEATEGDVFVGSKTLAFRIHTRDPREIGSYETGWQENSGAPDWAPFDEADNEEDLFRRRFGPHPQLDVILSSIPVLQEDKIRNHYSTRDDVSACESEYIILEKHQHVLLLNELRGFCRFARRTNSEWLGNSPFAGDIAAKWDKTARKGEFVVRLFLTPSAFTRNNNDENVCRLLGCWFDMLPFSLPTLTGGVDAQTEEARKRYLEPSIPVPPFRLGSRKREELESDMATQRDQSIAVQNEAATAFRSNLSLTPSTNAPIFGGSLSTEVGLDGALTRYFRGILASDMVKQTRASTTWVGRALGIVSHHRSMKQANISNLIPLHDHSESAFQSYLRNEDHALASQHFSSAASRIVSGTKSLHGLMQQLESLGHAPVGPVEGLTVELLDFQRQAVGWALEKERAPGGLHSFLWPALPNTADTKQEPVFFNPVINRFSKTKPSLVRGGMIGSCMGMGKTIMSLALILKNPAPTTPESGSLSSSISPSGTNDTAGVWDPDTTSTGGRGAILSRGTLVVCHVSLVGQWIEEAKSKLKDPGQVHSYHGQGRKRDAVALAKHSIVVTTYATLRSDKFLLSKKGGHDYVPPCEKVRWWRVVIDEGHTIRDGATQQTHAILSLVADHRWCVSGTPVNVSIKDLKNQLKFIGLADVDEMFRRFQPLIDTIEKKKSRSWRSRCDFSDHGRAAGAFLFLMRAVLIRHSLEQKYIGTDTKLMSLPPKEERVITVKFSASEEKEYKKLEGEALAFYEQFKSHKGRELSKHYLRVLQRLMPMRVACSGGGIPEMEVPDETKDDGENASSTLDMSDEEDQPTKKKTKKCVVSKVVFKSKFECLLRELIRLREEEPNAKCLIFSQFTSTLTWLQEELPKHGFDYRTLSGDMTMSKRARALHDFQHSPPTTVFLLSMRSGACGINLTQASRVFLLEPALNPALEAQAIGRVYRLGQKSRVEIIRVVMEDSIETRLRKMLEKKYGKEKEADDDESKPSGGGGPASMVGSLHADKTEVLTEEFDLLFGCPTVPKDSSPNDDGLQGNEEMSSEGGPDDGEESRENPEDDA